MLFPIDVLRGEMDVKETIIGFTDLLSESENVVVVFEDTSLPGRIHVDDRVTFNGQPVRQTLRMRFEYKKLTFFPEESGGNAREQQEKTAYR